VRDFNTIETQAVIKFFSLQGKAPKEIHAILTETLACFLPGRANDLSAQQYHSDSAKNLAFKWKDVIDKTFELRTCDFV